MALCYRRKRQMCARDRWDNTGPGLPGGSVFDSKQFWKGPHDRVRHSDIARAYGLETLRTGTFKMLRTRHVHFYFKFHLHFTCISPLVPNYREKQQKNSLKPTNWAWQ
jgi:hypothetical protein